jgi:hypothetical protein
VSAEVRRVVGRALSRIRNGETPPAGRGAGGGPAVGLASPRLRGSRRSGRREGAFHRSIAVLPFADIFAIQDEITAAIVDSLKVALKLGERAVLRKRSTDDPEAFIGSGPPAGLGPASMTRDALDSRLAEAGTTVDAAGGSGMDGPDGPDAGGDLRRGRPSVERDLVAPAGGSRRRERLEFTSVLLHARVRPSSVS